MKDHYCFFPPKRVIKVSLTSERNTIITLHSSVILFYFIQSHLKFVFLKEKERVSLKGQGWRDPCAVFGFKRDCRGPRTGEWAALQRRDGCWHGAGQPSLASTLAAPARLTRHRTHQRWVPRCQRALPEPGAGQSSGGSGGSTLLPTLGVLGLAGVGLRAGLSQDT